MAYLHIPLADIRREKWISLVEWHAEAVRIRDERSLIDIVKLMGT